MAKVGTHINFIRPLSVYLVATARLELGFGANEAGLRKGAEYADTRFYQCVLLLLLCFLQRWSVSSDHNGTPTKSCEHSKVHECFYQVCK